MRLGVLDIGSNAAHLRVSDAHPGSPPLPVFRFKAATDLAEAIRRDGAVSAAGVRQLIAAVCAAATAARARHVDELIPFVTSAVRDAANRDEILAAVRTEAGLELGYLSGEDEARLTYFAAHRWYGWATGPLLLLDIGGGSMEIAQGRDEDPALALSLPLGVRRLTRALLPDHPAKRRHVKRLRAHVREVLAPAVDRVREGGHRGAVVATSKTFKQLARFAGHTDPGRGTRLLYRHELRAWIPKLAAMTPEERAELPGVRAARAKHLLAGAVVAATAMSALGVDRVEFCPWALREGILLRRLEPLPMPDALPRAQLPDSGAGLPAGALSAAALSAGVSDLDEYRQARLAV